MAAPYLVADFAKHFGPDPNTAERAFDKPDATIPGFEQQPPRFGFRWFIPALAIHRGIWRDVLLASLAIQVIGLTTPLLTQITIDKVIAHHTYATLLAVAVGLSMSVSEVRDGQRHRRPAECRRERGAKPRYAIERTRGT